MESVTGHWFSRRCVEEVRRAASIALMTAVVPSSPAVRWKLAAWALAALGTADVVAVALSSERPLIGWLLAGGWFVGAAACAFRARRLARKG